jgi:hypothetical protein
MINLANSWQIHQSSVVPDTIFESSCVVFNDYLFFGGGLNASITTGTWYSVPLLPNNSFGQWRQISSMPQPVRWPALLGLTYDNYLIIVGGQSVPGFNNNTSNLQTVKLNSNGTMGNWNNNTSFNFVLNGTPYDPAGLPVTQGGSLIASNGKLYCISSVRM